MRASGTPERRDLGKVERTVDSIVRAHRVSRSPAVSSRNALLAVRVVPHATPHYPNYLRSGPTGYVVPRPDATRAHQS